MDGVWGAEWVYLALSGRTPLSPPHHPFPPPGLCMPWAPLLPLLSPGHSALLSIHNGSSVLGLLTLHSACALGSEHGQAGGGWGRVRGDTGGQEHSLTKCHPPNYHPHQPPGTYQTHTHTYTDGALKTSAIRPDHGTRQKNNPKQTSVPITPAVALCCDGSTGAWLSLATYVFSLSLQWAAGHRAHAVF